MSQRTLLDTLFALARSVDVRSQPTTDELTRELVEFGSSTESNVEMAKHLEIGPLGERGPYCVGTKIKGKPISVSSILNAVEDLGLPPAVAGYYPELTEAEWSAALRFATLVLSALERRTSQPSSTSADTDVDEE